MEIDPRSELFNRVIAIVDDIDLPDFNLSIFTKEKAEEVLAKLDKSSTPEEDLFEILIDSGCDKKTSNSAFDIVDMVDKVYGLSELPESAPSIARTIGYLYELIDKLKKGEAITMTAVALLKDGKASIWLPSGIHQEKVDEIYDPVVQELRETDPTKFMN